MTRRKRNHRALHGVKTKPSAPAHAHASDTSERHTSARSSADPRTTEKIVIALLFVVPVGFSRWTEDAWDFPKGIFLTTGALLLAGWGLAAELAGLQSAGFGSWMQSARARLISLVKRDGLAAAMLLFLLSSAISTFTSPNPGLGFYGTPGSYAGFLVACATTAVYFAARSLKGTATSFARLARATAVAAAIAAGYGILQFIGRDPFEWGLVAYLRGMRRITGTMGQPNLLGAYLVMSTPLITWLASRSRTSGARVAWIILGVLVFVAIGMTQSRASWIALVASGFLGALLYVKARPAEKPLVSGRAGLAAAAALLIVMAVGAWVLSRSSIGAQLIARAKETASLSETGNAARIHSWRSALRMTASKPLLGVGTDQFGLEFPMYRTPIYYRLEHGAVPLTAHNQAVNILATQGILGALAALLVVVLVAITIWRALRHREADVRSAVVAVAASLGGFLLWDLVNYTVAGVGVLAAALAGWVAGAAESAAGKEGQRVRATRRPAWSVVVAGILVLLAFIPFVLNPWRAQRAKRIARNSSAESVRHFESLRRAAALAPWDGRHAHHLAHSLLVLAVEERDSTRRRILLNQAESAEVQAIRSEPRNALAHAGYGSILAQIGRIDASRANISQVRAKFDEAIRLDPVNPKLMNQATQVLVGLNRFGDGHTIALHSVELYPEMANSLALIGVIALHEKRSSDAADTLNLALQRDWVGDTESRARARANLAAAYIDLGRFKEAYAAAEEALKEEPTLDAAIKNRDLAARMLATTGLPTK